MKCIRCEKEFDEYAPYRNAECYGVFVLYACPHCGKLYSFQRIVQIESAESFAINKEEDDWGHKVISDELYYKTNKKD